MAANSRPPRAGLSASRERLVMPTHRKLIHPLLGQSCAHGIAASIDRARSVLGYAPRYSSLETLHESLRWLVEHGEVDVGGQSF